MECGGVGGGGEKLQFRQRKSDDPGREQDDPGQGSDDPARSTTLGSCSG